MNETQANETQTAAAGPFADTAVVSADGTLVGVSYKTFRAHGSGPCAEAYEVFGEVFGAHDAGFGAEPARVRLIVAESHAAGPTCAEFETTDAAAVASSSSRSASTAGNGAVAPRVRVHVRTWLSGVVEITDLEQAGKRGKKCRRARYYGGDQKYGGGSSEGLGAATRRLIAVAHGFDPSRSFDEAVAALAAVVAERRAEAGPTGDLIDVEHSLIRGVDAPVFRLRALGPRSAVHAPRATFEAMADGDSVWVENGEDVYNGQTWTNRGNPRKAYAAAAKVWDKVKAAKTHREALDVLEAAGIEFRSYCSVD